MKIQSPEVSPRPRKEERLRLRALVRGSVQGVGFRPFVSRLASELDLTGWVRNTPEGVGIEVEGKRPAVERFLLRLESDRPPRAAIHGIEPCFLDPIGFTSFEILPSESTGAPTASAPPDIAPCAECLGEIFDPANRRHLYPFANCTNCGPRYSILESMPYDRAATTMKGFVMCPACRIEYEDPRDRRFHAQPNACPACGPRLELWDRHGKTLATGHGALLHAAKSLASGQILALKGLGGFQLVADARSIEVVARLRHRKRREEKPFALMAPSLEAIATECDVSELEQRLLRSPESPIVLLRKKSSLSGICPAVAPGNPELGFMLPSTPLHHILLRQLGFPVVATSGNLSDEPICTEEREALQRLGGIADLFLVHNRPIARPVDDSVARVLLGRELILRRARGYAPLPLPLDPPAPPLLAVGGHLKNTIALADGPRVLVSQHLGDLETTASFHAFQEAIHQLPSFHGITPGAIVCDRHPDYPSARFAIRMARESSRPLFRVQHHLAHVTACMVDNGLRAPVLGVSWDGTGYGSDGTVWGGEFLKIGERSWRRLARLMPFPLPGGEAAVREPRRTALGALFQTLGSQAFHLPWRRVFTEAELRVLRGMLERGVNTPMTSSAGRLFDAAASLLDLRHRNAYEGQAAMELEWNASDEADGATFDFSLVEEATEPWTVDWRPILSGLLEDQRQGVPTGKISAKFHRSMVALIVAVARRSGETRIVLTGGCFQNCRLTEWTVQRLRQEGLQPFWHQRIPPNDGGLSPGQIAAVAWGLEEFHG